jgi:hypothetical protein
LEYRTKKYYVRKKSEGLCPRCGKPLDREGHYCSVCVEKYNQYTRETRQYFIQNGICPVCRKEKLYGDEKTCIECLEKIYESRKPMNDEEREKYNESQRKRKKMQYDFRSQNGICTRCGKRKAEKDRKKCRICLEKENRRAMNKNVGERI